METLREPDQSIERNQGKCLSQAEERQIIKIPSKVNGFLLLDRGWCVWMLKVPRTPTLRYGEVLWYSRSACRGNGVSELPLQGILSKKGHIKPPFSALNFTLTQEASGSLRRPCEDCAMDSRE